MSAAWNVGGYAVNTYGKRSYAVAAETPPYLRTAKFGLLSFQVKGEGEKTSKQADCCREQRGLVVRCQLLLLLLLLLLLSLSAVVAAAVVVIVAAAAVVVAAVVVIVAVAAAVVVVVVVTFITSSKKSCEGLSALLPCLFLLPHTRTFTPSTITCTRCKRNIRRQVLILILSCSVTVVMMCCCPTNNSSVNLVMGCSEEVLSPYSNTCPHVSDTKILRAAQIANCTASVVADGVSVVIPTLVGCPPAGSQGVQHRPQLRGEAAEGAGDHRRGRREERHRIQDRLRGRG